jgi:hypothetical protein
MSGDITIVQTFLNSKLFSLSLGIVQPQSVTEALKTRGCIPSLRVLITKRPQFDFLQANPQLSKIDMIDNPARLSAQTLQSELFPILETFSNLTSLRVAWPEKCSILPKEGIQAIGKLQNLTQLCIMCGESSGRRRNWEVNHEELRNGLSKLRQLKRLALRGDTYSASGSGDPERYYVDTYATTADLGNSTSLSYIPVEQRGPMFDAAKGKSYWEKRHVRRMRTEAKK